MFTHTHTHTGARSASYSACKNDINNGRRCRRCCVYYRLPVLQSLACSKSAGVENKNKNAKEYGHGGEQKV